MRVVFASHGSLGDLVPFLEIGAVLRKRGHEVVVATHRAHAPAVEGRGLGFAPMRPDRPSNPVFHARYMAPFSGARFVYRDYLIPAIADSDADLSAACRDADILVSVTLALAAPIVAARLGIPWRSAAFQPAMLYSALDPPSLPMLPFWRGASDYNAWLLHVARKGIEAWVEPLRQYRRDAGLGEYPDHPVFNGQHSPEGVLALFSPLFGTVPADAPPGTVQTGQVLQTGDAPLPSALEHWLAAGEPPVVFTLGSASAHTAKSFFRQSAAIARRLDVRALLLVGREENLAGLGRNQSMFAARGAPYQAIFPHVQLAVHQGGIGTTSLALSAGKPMVLVPFAHDQHDNSRRAAQTGAALVTARWRYNLSGEAAIRYALRSDAMKSAAEKAAETINAEAGAERAADEIERAGRAGR